MRMLNPPHPGLFIRNEIIEPLIAAIAIEERGHDGPRSALCSICADRYQLLAQRQ